MMRSTGSTTLTLPPFAGATRKLVLVNLLTFFVLGLLSWFAPGFFSQLQVTLGLMPFAVLHGWVWQFLTYSFMNIGFLSTAFALLTLWFTATTLEESRGARWLVRLYYGSALVGGIGAVLLVLIGRLLPKGMTLFGGTGALYVGMFAPLFAVLVAFGLLFGDVEFLLFFLVRLKAKYLVAIMVVWRLALLVWSREVFSATVELCCGLFAYLYVRYAQVGYSSRTAAVSVSERWYGWRNDYYRWKRRRAAKSFQVYMRKQNREVHFDNEGRYVSPEDEKRDPNDKRWMN
ncbi:rhomboid family intramembrane serine protease [Terriglobus sp.]|uniref:rhomboid family intramembrane serine protease n=1 Tax=Terriglobus sp. TaxID=1889013 RepID=UPI003B00B5FC